MPARSRLLLALLLALPVTVALIVPAGAASADQAAGDQAAVVAAADEADLPDCAAQEPPAGEEPPDAEEDELCGPMAPGEFKALQDTSGGVGLPERALLLAAAQARQLPAIGGRWTAEGPDNIGGRVAGIAADPTRPDTVYVATASGGVWRSSDAGATYQPTWPTTFPQATGAIAVARDGTIYVGTGEANPGGGSMTYEGDGMYRSTDHGATWQHVGLLSSANIGAIAIDPADPQRVYVAAGGSLFRDGGDRGVFRTTDGGQSWTRVLAGTTPATGAMDVQLDPTDPDRVFASLWDRRRTPELRGYAGVGSGLFRSTDGGTTWQRLENVTAPAPGDTIGLRSDPHLGRIGIGVAAGIPGRVYVITSSFGPFGTELGFYRSDDGGDSFAAATKAGAGGDIWWTGKVWVDPRDGNHVFVPGINLRVSSDGGTTWANTSGMHVDHHAMSWDPNQPGRVYEGNDGGAYRSDAAGATGTWVKGTVEPWMQFYSVTVSEQDPTRIAGGLQDNGSVRTWGGPRWNSWGGGDGEQNLINPSNQDIGFNCSQFGSCRRTVDGGTTFRTLRGRVSDRFNWFAPLEFAADDPGVVYSGGNILNRSTDGGQNYLPISPDLTGGPGHDPVYPFGTLTTVASSATDPNEIVVGTDDGRVQVTRDLGATWTVTLQGQQWVTRVKVDPRNRDRIWVTLSGYRAGTGDGHVLMTDNGGRTWLDVTGKLPNAPVNDVVIGPAGFVFVATDVGVFVGTPAGRVWTRLGGDLPLAPVTDIQYNAASGRLFAATFGRGVYSLPVNPLSATSG
jgi:photosystem II stability/assembly factor-like uncharacterized protein